MKTSSIQYEDVRKAYLDLVEENQRPSFEAIYDKLGRRGGGARIKSLINQVFREIAEKAAVPVLDGLSRSLAQKVVTLVEGLMCEVRDQVAVDLRAVQEELALRTAELQDLREASSAEVARLQEMVAKQEVDFAIAREHHSAACESLEKSAQRLKEELDQRNLELEAVRARFDTKLARLEDERSGERKHLMEQTDAIRKELSASIDSSRRRLVELEDLVAHYRSRSAEAERELRRARGRLDKGRNASRRSGQVR